MRILTKKNVFPIPQGVRPATFDSSFHEAKEHFVETYLLSAESVNDLVLQVIILRQFEL